MDDKLLKQIKNLSPDDLETVIRYAFNLLNESHVNTGKLHDLVDELMDQI